MVMMNRQGTGNNDTVDRACVHCGAQIWLDAKFCVSCGTRAGRPRKTATCAQCGAPLRSDASFCVGCGVPAVPREPFWMLARRHEPEWRLPSGPVAPSKRPGRSYRG